ALEPELTELQHLRREVDQRRQQLAGQPAIEQAKGILMHNFGLTPDEAFALLRRISQDTNLKVRAIADQLVMALTGHVTPQAAERVATVIEELRQQARTVH
ncbi:MAG TPA: ANTAR domain-containing protein, partial [Jiangellaceae bacterium]|nr:ANTAR domain-containing protein [Jiangellaceae bacterium]